MRKKKQTAIEKPPDPQEQRRALIRRVSTKDANTEDVIAFGALMRSEPDQWKKTGNMIDQAAEHFIDSLSTNDMTKEIIRFRCERLRADLREDTDGPLEHLMIDHAVMCWLRLGIMQQHYTKATGGSLSIALALLWEKRLSSAQKRFDNACVSLARTRKLMRPKASNQVLIGELNFDPCAGIKKAREALKANGAG